MARAVVFSVKNVRSSSIVTWTNATFSCAALFLIATMLGGCPSGDGPSDAGTDAGSYDPPDVIACEDLEDCPDATNYDCFGGVCYLKCVNNSVCPPETYCSSRQFCEPGCRETAECATDEICIMGSCEPAENQTSCGDKCDCETGEICDGNVCIPPPTTCASSDDCPRGPDEETCNALVCDGFTFECKFVVEPACSDVEDCSWRPNCADGCICENDVCLPSTPCTEATVLADCGTGFFCNDDDDCEPFADCTSTAQCPGGQECNLAFGVCEIPQTCVDSGDCVAPQDFCDTTLVIPKCIVPTCGPPANEACPLNQQCESNQCVPIGGLGDCADNNDCPNTPWPDTEYCAITPGQTQGECSSGCQNNSSCPTDFVCNSSRQCVDNGGGGLGQEFDSCADSAECAAGLTCSLIGVCRELCGGASTPCDPLADPNCCAVTGHDFCVPGLVVAFCQAAQ